MDGTYVKLFRSIQQWEWYTDPSVKITFLHCLVQANRFERRHKGTLIESGSFPTSYEKFAIECGLTVQQVRTSLKKLKSTGELTYKSTNDGTIISVVKWGDYQSGEDSANTQINTQDNKQITNEQQTNNKRITTLKKDKKEKKEKNNTNIGVFAQYSGDNLLLLKALEDFDAMRKDIKKPMSDRARQLLCAKLTELSSQGENIIDCLNESVLHSWQGVFPKKREQRSGKTEPIPDYEQPKSMSADEIEALKERMRKL